MVRVTSSPGLNELRAQPSLAISCGLLVSTIQCVCSPLSFLPSIFRKQCGLAQSHSVTVPDTLTFLSVSYAAFPWCANSEVEIMNKPIATAKIIASLCLMLKSSVPMNFRRPSAVTVTLTYLAGLRLLANAGITGSWQPPNLHQIARRRRRCFSLDGIRNAKVSVSVIRSFRVRVGRRCESGTIVFAAILSAKRDSWRGPQKSRFEDD